jgi:hypothetical protein
MREISVDAYETPSGSIGWRVSAPLIPGCVVFHRSDVHAVMLVREAVLAMHKEDGEAAPTDVSDEIPWWSTTA